MVCILLSVGVDFDWCASTIRSRDAQKSHVCGQDVISFEQRAFPENEVSVTKTCFLRRSVFCGRGCREIPGRSIFCVESRRELFSTVEKGLRRRCFWSSVALRELILVAMSESWCAAARGRLKPAFLVVLLEVPRHALDIDNVRVTQ